MYGEQGAESIHAQFNTLYRTYCRMKPSSRHLECMMREHLTRFHPWAKQLRPTIQQHKRKHED